MNNKQKFGVFCFLLLILLLSGCAVESMSEYSTSCMNSPCQTKCGIEYKEYCIGSTAYHHVSTGGCDDWEYNESEYSICGYAARQGYIEG